MFREHVFHGGHFFRHARRGSAFHRGDLKYIILDMIKDSPRHGYDIIRELEERSHGLYKPSPGVIYPTLQMLEEMGYAVSADQEGKKAFSITEEGREFLVRQSEVADNIRDRMKHRWGFKNIGKMVMVMKEYHALENLLGGGLRSLDAEKAEEIRQILIRTYQEIETILQD